MSSKKGKAVRIYSINRVRLKEVLDAIDELIKPLKDKLKETKNGS